MTEHDDAPDAHDASMGRSGTATAGRFTSVASDPGAPDLGAADTSVDHGADPVAAACAYAARELALRADAQQAVDMQAYMKSDMPFYGVKKPARVPILRELVRRFPPDDHGGYVRLVAGLWQQPHREERYLAIGVARAYPVHVVPASLALYHQLVVTGAWWDFVDEIATHLIRTLVLEHPEAVWPAVERWVDDDDLWVRRTAILCQVGAKRHTDPERLFAFSLARAHETAFFIRKAIGWALRDYAKTDPDAVAAFVAQHRGSLAPLTVREATKHLGGHRLLSGG